MKAQRGMHQCESCGKILHHTEMKDIEDLELRVSPGDIVPSGECPDEECGAVCHPFKVAIIEETIAVDVGVTAYLETDSSQDDSFNDLFEGEQINVLKGQIVDRLRDIIDDPACLHGQVQKMVLTRRKVLE